MKSSRRGLCGYQAHTYINIHASNTNGVFWGVFKFKSNFEFMRLVFIIFYYTLYFFLISAFLIDYTSSYHNTHTTKVYIHHSTLVVSPPSFRFSLKKWFIG